MRPAQQTPRVRVRLRNRTITMPPPIAYEKESRVHRAPEPSARALRFMIALCLACACLGAGSIASAAESVGGVSIEADPALAAAVPEVSMPAGALRTGDGRTLWDRDADAERAMASTTKIMTALVVLDSTELTERVTVTGSAAGVGEAEAGLVAGESYTVQQLLEAMLVRSGNDAAFALAEHVAGDESAFVALMNEKAAELGLSHTAFTNPHGLDEHGHHTSAADLATLTSVAMADPRFAAIVNMPRVSVTAGGRTTTFDELEQAPGNIRRSHGRQDGMDERRRLLPRRLGPTREDLVHRGGTRHVVRGRPVRAGAHAARLGFRALR